MSTAGGSGAANDAEVFFQENREYIERGAALMAEYQTMRNGRNALEILAEEAEVAADGADAKVEKQQQHLADAKANAKLLRAEAVKARKAADKAMGE